MLRKWSRRRRIMWFTKGLWLSLLNNQWSNLRVMGNYSQSHKEVWELNTSAITVEFKVTPEPIVISCKHWRIQVLKDRRTNKWQEDLGYWAIKRSRWWFRSDGCDENIGAFTICLESFPRRFESPNTHTQSYIVLFICICFECYYIIVFDQSFLVFMSKIQKHIKSRKSKKFDQHCCVLSQAYFALYLCTNGLCIYERNLFPMHSYHCGRNLDFYVIVVNRSSNLPWMISQWSLLILRHA